MFIKNIYKDNDYYIEKDGAQIVKFYSSEAEEYTTISKNEKIHIFYEDKLGNIIKLTIENEGLHKEFILYSKEKKNIKKHINAHFREDELILLFSSYYKRLTLINIYTERNGICVFDTCDNRNFVSFKKKNNDILVIYRKGIHLGYSLLTGDSYSDYKLINSTTPVSAYESESGIYLLCYEDRYTLVDISGSKKYYLPLVFGIKPHVIFEDSQIFLVYIKGRREIVYKISDGVVLFHSENML